MAYAETRANRVLVEAGSGYDYETEKLTPDEARALAAEILAAADAAEMCPEPPPYVRQPTPEGALNGYFVERYRPDPNCHALQAFGIMNHSFPFRPRMP